MCDIPHVVFTMVLVCLPIVLDGQLVIHWTIFDVLPGETLISLAGLLAVYMYLTLTLRLEYLHINCIISTCRVTCLVNCKWLVRWPSSYHSLTQSDFTQECLMSTVDYQGHVCVLNTYSQAYLEIVKSQWKTCTRWMSRLTCTVNMYVMS